MQRTCMRLILAVVVAYGLIAASWAATGLAGVGGDKALGALEFAEHNHASTRVREFITRLLDDPATARDDLEVGQW